MVMTVYQQPSPLEVHVQPSRVVGIIDERFPQPAAGPVLVVWPRVPRLVPRAAASRFQSAEILFAGSRS